MKIQHKRSNQLDGSSAKKPTSEFMEYGELAVNFNETDPAIFLKDSNDNIVRIAGAGANGNIEIPDAGSDPHQPGTSDDRYVEVAGDNMTGDLTLGTDKITLDASDGSAEFAAGNLDINQNGDLQSVNIDVSSNEGKGGFKLLGANPIDASGRLEIQGKPGATGNFGAISVYKANVENIKLALDGSAEFAGTVSQQNFQATTSTGGNHSFVYGASNNNAVQSDGEGRSIRFKQGWRKTSADGAAQIRSSLFAQISTNSAITNKLVTEAYFNSSISGDKNGVYQFWGDDTPSYIYSDGSAEFAGDVKTNGLNSSNGIATSPGVYVSNDSGLADGVNGAFISQNAVGAATTTIFSDGSAEFAKSIVAGGTDPDTQPIIAALTGRNKSSSAGTIEVINTEPSGRLFLGFNENAQQTIAISNNGSAEFAGGDISLNADGSARLVGDGSEIIRLEPNGGAPRIDLLAGSSGETVTLAIGSYDKDGVKLLCDASNSWLAANGEPCITHSVRGVEVMAIDKESVLIGGTLPASPNIELNVNGNAEFAGAVQIDDRLTVQNLVDPDYTINFARVAAGDFSDAGSKNLLIASGGANLGGVSAGAQIGWTVSGIKDSAYLAFGGNYLAPFFTFSDDLRFGATPELTATNPTIQLKTDGSAAFAGQVQTDKQFQVDHPAGALYAAIVVNCGGAASTGLSIAGPSGTGALFTADGTCYIGGTPPTSPNIKLNAEGSATFIGAVTAPNVTFNLDPDNDANYTTTTEEYTETESYTGPLGNTLEREVTKTRDVRTYIGPTLDVKERLQNLIARLDSLEAEELADDATSTLLLTTVNNLNADMAKTKAALAAIRTAANAAGTLEQLKADIVTATADI